MFSARCSKMDMLLAKAEPITGDGAALWDSRFKKRKEVSAQEQFQTGYKRVRMCEQHNSAPRPMEKEGEEVFQAPEQRLLFLTSW